MSYYLEPQEGFAEGIARIGTEQNAKAIAALEEQPDGVHKGIHKARKHFKKLRAIFRLIRDETGQGYYKPSNVFYRDLGRELAPLRDVTSLIEALEMLENQFHDQVKKATFDELKGLLEAERQAVKKALLEDGDRLKEVVGKLKGARDWYLSMPISDDHLRDTVHSFRRVYKRGYKRYHKALKQTTPHQMHQWRKRVKYLWYHHRLLKQNWPKVYKAYAKSIKQLSDYLGDHHDFALLEQKVERESGKLSANTCRVLRALCQEQQKRLEERAFRQGSLIYAEKPDAFAARHRVCLEVGLLSL